MNDFPFKKHGFFKFDNPIEIEEMAKIYAQKRIKSNSALHEVAPEYDRGSLATNVDELGIIAELIGISFLEKNNIQFDAVSVFEEHPVKSADVFINESKIDIKGVQINKEELTVNRKAHFKKDITDYWFIKPLREEGKLTGEAEYWMISAVSVSVWKVNNSSFTPFFYRNIIEVNNLLDEKTAKI